MAGFFGVVSVLAGVVVDALAASVEEEDEVADGNFLPTATATATKATSHLNKF